MNLNLKDIICMEKSKKEKRSWLWILLLVVVGCAAIALFMRGCQGETDEKGGVVEGAEQDTVVVFEQDSVAETEELDLDSLNVVDEESGVVSDSTETAEMKEEKDEEDVKEELQGKDDKKDKKDADLETELKRQEQLRKEAEEARAKQEKEEAERQRVEEEARLEAERKRLEEEAEARLMNEGVLSGTFSVAYNKKIRFSQGNLQYQASTDTWRFAANQWDYEGHRNEEIDPDNVGWIDLFGWGTSGYNKKYPFMISRRFADYVPGERNIANTKYDWGFYNPISNGGNKEKLWRVLTNNEWRYLFCKRKNASSLFTFATVAGVKGLVVLPDDWKKPAGVNFELSINKGMKYIGDDEYINNVPKTSLFDHNVLSINAWRILEENGAVFLPAAGGRDYANVFEVQLCGFYWSSTHLDEGEAYMVGFSSGNFVAADYEIRSSGFSVRLVRDVQVK